jgi:hypothetical protein
MTLPNILKEIAGMYLLSPTGQLGFLGSDNRLVVDPALTERFAAHNAAFLKSYLGHPDEPGMRLGIIYHSTSKEWGSLTFALETLLVRSLYPVGGAKTDTLTAFQRKNREKSMYQSMELLLDYRHDAMPDAVVYAPVLYNRGTTLADYPSLLERPVLESDKKTPVFEVLNLVEGLPASRRGSAEFHDLQEAIYRSAVKKDMRKSSDDRFHGLIDNPFNAQRSTGPVENAFDSVDKRSERQIVSTEGYHTALAGDAGFLDLLETLGGRQMEQWLAMPPTPVSPEVLATFNTFRNLDEAVLARAARRTLEHRAPAGVRLLDKNTSDEWNLYLDGTLQLDANDGVMQLTEGGSDKARSPVAFLKPRKYTVTTLTPVTFLWVHDDVIRLAQNERTEVDTTGRAQLSILRKPGDS